MNFGQYVLPNDCFGPVIIHAIDESSVPCIKITGCFPGLAIRCASKMYPSSVTMLCTSDGYPYALMSFGYILNDIEIINAIISIKFCKVKIILKSYLPVKA